VMNVSRTPQTWSLDVVSKKYEITDDVNRFVVPDINGSDTELVTVRRIR
jgi:hypothetical protein